MAHKSSLFTPITHRLTQTVRSLQSKTFVLGALTNDLPYFAELRHKLAEADAGTIDNDFGKAEGAPIVKMRRLQQQLKMIEQRFGEAFSNMLDPFGSALGTVIAGLDQLDQALGKVGTSLNTVIGWGGGFLALSAAMGLLLPVLRVAGAGFMLLLAPLRLVWAAMTLVAAAAAVIGAPFELGAVAVLAAVATIAGGAVLLWRHWGAVQSFFEGLWQTVEDTFALFANFVGGWIASEVAGVIQSFKDAWNGLTGFFTKLISDWTAPFDAFIKNIQDKIAALRNGAAGRTLGLDDKSTDPNLAAPPGASPGGAQPYAPWLYSPMRYQSGEGGRPDMGLNVNIKVDQGRVIDVSATPSGTLRRVDVDRGQMAARA